MYRFYNANAKNNFINDCTIRAISVIEGKTWDETYKELSMLAMNQGLLLDDVDFIRPLLDKKYVRIKGPEKTIGEFAENNPVGKYLITTKGHITCCINGVIIDTWDCRDREIEYVWLT